MTPLFGWIAWNRHAPSQGEGTAANVNAALSGRYAECIRLLTDPVTEEERRQVAELEQRWLASRAMGC
jgi:hypothetical protein